MAKISALQPKLRFSSFAEPYEQTTLGEYFTFKNGVNADKGSYGTGRKFINVLDVIAEQPITHDSIIGSVSINDAEFQKNEVVFGDVLFQRSSETREEVGQSNIYLDKNCSATFGGFVIRGRPKKRFVPEYFNALLKTQAVRKDMTSRSGGSTRYNIGQEALEKVSVCVTKDKAEQQKIAAFLSAVDEKIAQLTRKKALLEAYKKGCMQQLFSQKIRFKDDQGNDFPDWEEKRLGDLVDINPRSETFPETFNYIDLEAVNHGELFGYKLLSKYEAPSRAQRVLQKNDILFQLVRPYQKNNLFFELSGDFVASTGYAQLRTQECPKFIYYGLHTDQFVKVVLQRSTGSNYPAINSEDLKTIKFGTPSLPEQQKIAVLLSSIDKKIHLLTVEIQLAQTFKKGLLQQMFV